MNGAETRLVAVFSTKAFVTNAKIDSSILITVNALFLNLTQLAWEIIRTDAWQAIHLTAILTYRYFFPAFLATPVGLADAGPGGGVQSSVKSAVGFNMTVFTGVETDTFAWIGCCIIGPAIRAKLFVTGAAGESYVADANRRVIFNVAFLCLVFVGCTVCKVAESLVTVVSEMESQLKVFVSFNRSKFNNLLLTCLGKEKEEAEGYQETSLWFCLNID